MIPFLPSQNPNIAALLATAGGAAPRVGADAGGNFAPVFGNAIVGQLVAGMPTTAFSGGEENINPAAWAQLAEAVRVLTQNGPVSPATLEQMRGVMLVNIELLRRGVGETLAMQSGSVLPTVQPVAPMGVQGVPVSDALIPAPAVSPTDEASGRRRDSVGGAEAMLMAAASGMPAPAISSPRPEMNVEQAFAALERIVAQAPASELVPLARALRQVINTPVPMATPAMTGKMDVSAVNSGIRNVQVSLPRVAEASPVSVQPVNTSSPTPVSNPASMPVVQVPAVSGQVPVQIASTTPAINTVATVTGMTIEAVAFVAQASVQAAVVPAIDEAVQVVAPSITIETEVAPAPVQAAMVPATDEAIQVVAPSITIEAEVAQAPVQPVVISSVDETIPVISSSVSETAPMFIPADNARLANTPAFAVARQDAGVELEAVAVSSGEVAPIIAEPVDEPVAWLARQAQVGQAPANANAPAGVASIPVVGINEADANVAPAIIPATSAESRPVMTGVSISPVVPAGLPAVAISTLPVEPMSANSVAPGQVAKATVANIDANVGVVSAGADETAPVSSQPIREQAVQVNVATRPAVAGNVVPVQNNAVSAPVAVIAEPVITPSQVVATPVATATTPVAVQTGGESTSESMETTVATATNSAPAVEGDQASRQTDRTPALAGREGDEKAVKNPVSAKETPAQAVERTEAPGRAKTARMGATETANTAADAAINAARGQAREAVSLPIAVQAVMARVADAIATAKPGEIRQLDLKLATPELGMVRVKFEVGEEGMVRVVIRTSTEMAATAIRDGLPQFRDTVESRHISVQVTQVAVGTATDFGGGNNPQARSEWLNPFQPQASAVNRDEPEFVARAPEGALRRRTLVDILA